MMNRIDKELSFIKKANNYRNLPHTELHHEYIVAASNDYLSLAHDKRVIEAAKRSVEEMGTSSTGSRLTTGNMYLHEQLEKELASFKKMESCLIFSSGYLANIGVITALANNKSIIFSDEYNHASIIDACRLSKAKIVVYRHNDMEDLEQKLKKYQFHREKIIVTDGVFSMDGDLAPLNELNDLKEKYEALFIVDDAHGTGVIGETGRGSSEYYATAPDCLIGTLSKAMAAEGGYVCASEKIINYLRQKARTFIFQTALSPANVGAALKSLHIIQTEKRHLELQKKANNLRKFLQSNHYEVPDGITPIIPIILGKSKSAVEMQNKLADEHIFIPAIRPPTVPKNKSRLRLTLQYSHTEAELNHMKRVFKRLSTYFIKG